MTDTLVATKCSGLCINNETLKIIYQHVIFLVSYKYSTALKILKDRNRGFDKDDFIQDCVSLILNSFETKSFETIYHLKSFINKTMNFYFLREKRKYYQTKQRASYNQCSLDEYETDDYFIYKSVNCQKDINLDKLYLDSIKNKNLYVIYNNNKVLDVCDISKVKEYKYGCILSVNSFIKLQLECGFKETCRIYKQKGFYMTKKRFDEISQAIIDYANTNGYIPKYVESKKYVYNRPSIEEEVSRLTKLANTCTCGYVNKDLVLSDITWQCPRCGETHDRDTLIKHNLAKV